jgi:hypothetical protein
MSSSKAKALKSKQVLPMGS